MFCGTFQNSQDNICDGVFSKSVRLQLRTSSKVLPVKCVKFFRTARTTSTTFCECFCFGSCPSGALSKQQVFGSSNKSYRSIKHSLQVVRAILWNRFPEKGLGTFLKICPWWSSVTIKSQVKVTESAFRHFTFLNIFKFFRGAIM